MIASLLLWGCAQVEAPVTSSPLDGGWPAVLAARPAAFTEAVDANREGWIALHQNDLAGALATGGVVEQRAAEELEALHAELAALAGQVWERTFSTWQSRAGLPAGSAIPLVAALAALDAGEVERSAQWLNTGKPFNDPSIAALAEQLYGGLSAAAGEGLAGCIAAHNQIRQGGARSLLAACPDGPLLNESTETHTRRLHDPLIYGSLAALVRHKAGGPSGLDGILFSGRWTEADRMLATDPTLAALGLTGPGITPQSARDFVRALDVQLSLWAEGSGVANAEGAALLSELQLLPAWRARLLTALAREQLSEQRPQVALALGQQALDVEHGRVISPVNPPLLFAVLTTASFQSGRTREALEYFAPLAAAWPEFAGLNETLQDLVVLENIERLGDSKEN